MTIIRNPSAAGLSDPSIVRQTEAGLAQSSLIARGKPAVVNNGLVLPSTTLTTTSNTVVATTSQNNQSADTVTIYESSGNVYVSSIDQIVNKTTINNPIAGVSSIIAGDNITITSSNGDGTGNVTINASGGGGGGTPGGSNTQIQFNDAGSFGGNGGFTFNKTTGIFTSPFVAGNGNGLSNIQGANISGAVGLATFAGTANAVAGGNVSGAVGLATYATTANAVAGGNVSGAVANANTALKIANGTSNINIPAVNGNIVVTAGGSNAWTFDTSGNVAIPGGIIGSGNLKLSPDSTNVGAYLDIFLTSGPDVHLVASQSANLILGKDDQSNVMTSWDGNVYVQSWDVNTNTQGGVWTFGGDGNLTTPGVSGNITGANVIEANTFAIAGGTTLNQVEGPNTVGFYNSSANTQFLFELGSSNVWGFDGNTGGTIFPQLSVQRGDNPSGTITGQTLLFNDSTQEAIISTPDGTSGINSSQRLVINPGAGYANTAGEGGDIYLWAGRGGNASGTGGDIKIRGGQGGANTSGGSGGDGGYIRIEAGDASSAGAPGYVTVVGGNSATIGGGYVEILGGRGATVGGDANLKGGYGTATGGNVNIWGGGSGNGQVNEGHVNIQTGGNTWTFNTSGNLTLPGSIIGSGNLYIAPDSNNTSGRLDIFLTAGPDIHIAGVGENLILGRDDTANVTVGVDGNVYVQAFAGGPSIWTFDNGGDLTVPGNSTIGTTIATGGAGGNSVTIRAGSSDLFATDPGGDLNLIGGYGSFGDGGGPAGGNVNITSGGSYDSHAGNVNISTDSFTFWAFDYNGNLSTPGEIIINSNNAHGGAGYAGIMSMTNTTAGSTNPNKFIRLNSTGNLEIINSSYTTTILGLSDSGNLTIPSTVTANYFSGDGSNVSNVPISWTTAPVSNTSSGTVGQAAYDSGGNLFICVATDTWTKITGTTSW